MQITNHQRLPEPLYRAVSRQRPRLPKRISVTELLMPPQIRALQLKYQDQIEEDASDRLWAAMGSLMHTLLENHGQLEDHLTEQFLEMQVDGWKVTGVTDLFHVPAGKITDWKLTSVWSTIDGLKPEWRDQVNLYAVLLRNAGHEVNAAEIVTIFRDWSKSRANDKGYPQSQVRVYDVPLMNPDEAYSFLLERLQLHQKAERGEYDDCTAAERWERPPTFRVEKKGRKSALRVLNSEDEAVKWQLENGFENDPSISIVPRAGASIRCESYCSVAPFCSQWKRIKDASASA
jgi:hypothetical protein